MTYSKSAALFLAGLLFVATAFTMTPNPIAQAAAAGPGIEVFADTINYDSVQGVVDAQGGVQMQQNGSTVTGSTVHYNTQTLEGIITGGVKAVKGDATLTADTVQSYQNTRLVATGDPLLVKGESTLRGPVIDYDSAKQYAIVPSAAVLTTADGTLTTDKLEVFFADDRAVGDGNVHLVSPPRQIDATSNHIVYTGMQTSGKGQAVLTGDARAVQEGNVIVGDTLTINMDSQSATATGRTKLVIIPQ
jgi:lipopolysaccharide export system protein LptA